jgi:hypothetical protein
VTNFLDNKNALGSNFLGSEAIIHCSSAGFVVGPQNAKTFD